MKKKLPGELFSFLFLLFVFSQFLIFKILFFLKADSVECAFYLLSLDKEEIIIIGAA